MKRYISILFCLALIGKANAQQQELQQLMLNTQKLAQFKQILRDMKSGYEVISKGYGTIKNISEGNYKLHKTFLDGLLQVSPSVRNYSRVGDIVRFQSQMVQEYKSSSQVFRKVPYYSGSELEYFERIYQNLLKQSLRNLNELAGVLTAGEMRMNDDERIQAIDRIYVDMERKLTFLRGFNNEAKSLGISRARDGKDTDALSALYGLTK